jgi:hypothetical protein
MKAFFSQPEAALSQRDGWSIWKSKKDAISGLPRPPNRAMIHLAFC